MKISGREFRTSRLVLTSCANKTFSATLCARSGQLMWGGEEEEERGREGKLNPRVAERMTWPQKIVEGNKVYGHTVEIMGM
jgi:hypothetical protein